MITYARRDTTFTKGVVLALVGALMVIFYVVPFVLLALGLSVLVGGFILIGVAIFRFRGRLRMSSAWRS